MTMSKTRRRKERRNKTNHTSVPTSVSIPGPMPRLWSMSESRPKVIFILKKEIVSLCQMHWKQAIFSHDTACLQRCHITMSFWYMRSGKSLNEEFGFSQMRQLFSWRRITSGEMLGCYFSILQSPTMPHPLCFIWREYGERKRSSLWTVQWGAAGGDNDKYIYMKYSR